MIISMTNHEAYMSMALELAKDASRVGEAPVGCVIVDSSGNIIGRGQNRREASKSAIAHAEIEAILNACETIGDWRLSGCSLYVTLEPCPMCAGAIIMSRIDRLFYGASDELTGSCGSVINLFMEPYGHKVEVTGGVLADDSSPLLTDFFSHLRK
jgi:tRNA(adenine34) deaminase